MSGTTSSRSIAVVVVHGVADQEPHESARAIAAMLSSRNAGGPRYTTFTEDDIRVDVEPPIKPPPSDSPASRASSLSKESSLESSRKHARKPSRETLDPDEGTFYKQASALAGDADSGGLEGGAAVPPAPGRERGGAPDPDREREPGMVMMLGQLKRYRPSANEAVYRTVRLSAHQINGQTRTPVHVYEMYWADLSRLGQGVLRIFGELYQLLLHLPSLGRHAVDAAAIDDGAKNPKWRRLMEFQRWAAYLLTVPIPIINLWILGCVLVGLSGALLAKLAPLLHPVPVVLAVGLGALLGLSAALSRWPSLAFPLWTVVPFALIGACGWLYLALIRANYAFHATAFLTIAMVFGGGLWLLTLYRRTQPHCWKFGCWALGAVVAGSILSIARLPAPATPGAILNAMLRVVEIATIAVFLTWVGLFIMQVLAWGSGLLAVRASAPPKTADPADPAVTRHDRLKRAERTARLTLGIPIVIFVVLTMMVWAGLYQLLVRMAPADCYQPILLHYYTGTSGSCAPAFTPADAALQLLLLSAPELVILLVIVGLAIILALWATLPVVISEVRLPKDGADPAHLGVWLDRGFRLLGGAGTLLIITSFLVVPLAGLIQGIRSPEGTKLLVWLFDVIGRSGLVNLTVTPGEVQEGTVTISEWSAGALKFIGTLIAGTAVGVLAFSGRLKTLTGGIRPVLDVLLDVDSYLREHPLDNNPRARIFARYMALLRHVCEWRDADGRPYDAVVIISHSQGSVITVDLLRFLRRYKQEQLACLGEPQLPIRLLTMGSPLRQLYGLRFPHFYQWARHGESAADSASIATIADGRLPDPASAKVESWTNVYRSADYVGRHLWRVDEDRRNMVLPRPLDKPVENISADANGVRREYCVGSGAHIRYWDGTTPFVGMALDELIRPNPANGTPAPAPAPAQVPAAVGSTTDDI